MSDEELRADVLDELRTEPAARKSRIYVRAHDGTVTITGQVSSFSEKQKIDAAVTRVAGPEALNTEISIKRRPAVRQGTVPETRPAPEREAEAPAPERHDPIAVVKSLGLRTDTPRAVVKSIVGAVQARPESNLKEVELALSNFNLPSLLKPDATVHSLATGLNDLAHSGKWPRLVPKD